ncbi:MAG: U32 family peptidase [Leptospiraceae bacterium]|nr:U32 family peptidase [Leptospiraceae bacterium]MDW8305459.1 U32 family peptidase [Leptospiraceae bacterium]
MPDGFWRIPELLLPAGSLHKAEVAYLYGADSVYCGVPRYSLRVRENEFRLENLRDAVALARRFGKKIYFTVNAIPRNSKIGGFPRYLDVMAELKPDGLIMADPGLILIARERHPELALHISVQANTMNYAAVKFWQKVGAQRVILSREVTIPEIAEIRQRVPDIELEVFVHGSICIAHSGRCFMSNYFDRRDANQGACNNACRDEYRVFVANKRQHDEPMELVETDEGTFLMNSKDLRAIEYLAHLARAGVDCVKVEGRTKNDYYVAMVARAYRKALDDLAEGKNFDPGLLAELDKVASRGYFSGFLTMGMADVREEERQFQNYSHGTSQVQSHFYIGCVKKWENGYLYFDLKNRLRLGDVVEIYRHDQFEPLFLKVTEIIHKGEAVGVLSGGIGEIAIACPEYVPAKSFVALKNPNWLNSKSKELSISS